MTTKGRQVWTVLGGLIAGLGLGGGAQAFVGESSSLLFAGALVGLGIGVMVMCATSY